MKKVISLITIAAAVFSCAAGASASGKRPGGQPGNSSSPVAPMAANTPQTNLDTFSLNSTNRKLEAKVGTQGWPARSPEPGYNIVRAFTNSANRRMLLLLNGNTGEAESFELNHDGSVGKAPWWTGIHPLAELRCNAAELVRSGEVTKLVTEDSFSGMIRTFTMNDDGSPDISSMKSKQLSDMKDKNLFSVYENQITPYLTTAAMIGVDTWSGDVAVYSLDMQKLASPQWTRGWTSIDHLTAGQVTYRLLYKAAGDPYKRPGESGDEARRVRIETVSTDGSSQVFQETDLDATGGDYSSARFIEFPPFRGRSSYGVFFYKRTTGDFTLYEFNTQNGLGAKLDSGQLPKGAMEDPSAPPLPYVDVDSYINNGKTCLALVNADNAKPVSFDQAERMGRIIDQSLSGHLVGYQFIFAQSGRILFSRAGGKLKLDHIPAAEQDMTVRDQLNVGSVSKVITTVTALKLADQDLLDFSSNISEKVDPSQYMPGSWVTRTPLFNLFTHTSGLSKAAAGCSTDDTTHTIDCSAFFSDTPDSNPPCGLDSDNKWNCNRVYNNANFRAVRKVIEFATQTQNSYQIVKETQDRWAEAAGLVDMTCKVNPNAYYYGPCNGAGDCFDYAGKSWRREREADQTSFSANCSSGGWYASSRELIEFLSAIRYRKMLSVNSNALLLKTDLKDIDDPADKDGNATAFGWDPPWSADDQLNLNKGGYAPWSGVAAKAYITRLPNNCDAVIQFNSETNQSGTGRIQDVYKYVVLGQPAILKNDDDFSAINDVADNTVINTTRSSPGGSRHVTVSRNKSGNLNLKGFRVTHPGEYGGDVAVVTQTTTSGLTPPAFASPEIAVTDGEDFATASLGIASQLNLITWQYDGSQLVKHASALGALGKEVAVTRIASTGSLNRIVTAIRNFDNKLQLDVWDFNNIHGAPHISAVTHKDTMVDKWAEAITIKNLGVADDLSQTARFVTAHINDNHHLAVQAWTVDASGHLQKTDDITGITPMPIVSVNAAFPTRIAIDTAGDGDGGFFDGSGFMTTYIAGNGQLQAVTWIVDADKITLKNYIEAPEEIRNQTLAAKYSIVALADDPDTEKDEGGLVTLIKWAIDGNGMITRIVDRSTSTRATRISATGNLVTAFQLSPIGMLNVDNWMVLK